MEKKIIYQVLPRLWGTGKFSEWDGRTLAWFRSFGVDVLWFTGIPRHATRLPFVKGDPGSPYAIEDWYDTNPYLADDPGARMAEFRALVARCHAAGIRVMTDFIPNHVACSYRGNAAVHSWCDGDWTDTRKLDYNNPATEAELVQVLRFWASQGVDGFRCDMVELVPPDALGRILSAVRREVPGLLFVAEVYGRDAYRRYLDEVGFDLLYDKSGMYDILRGIVQGHRQARELTWNWQFLGDMQSRMLLFLENHDEQRIPSPWFAGDVSRSWAALATTALFNNASLMLYCGQEVGEDAAEGTEGRTSIFSRCHPKGIAALHDFIQGGLPLPQDREVIYKRYREMMKLASSPLFRSGRTWDLCYCNTETPGFDPARHFAFLRYDDQVRTLVFCNFSDERARIPLHIAPEVGGGTQVVEAAPWDFCIKDLPRQSFSFFE